MSYTIMGTIDRCGIEIEYEAEINITTWGDGGSYWDPPEPPEWEVESIRSLHARLDLMNELTDEELAELDDQISDKIGDWESDAAEDYYEWRQQCAYG